MLTKHFRSDLFDDSGNGQQFHQYQSPLTETQKGGKHHLMLEMQVMAWDRINDRVRKKSLQQGTPMTTPTN